MTFDDLFQLWPNQATMAQDAGVTVEGVKQWKKRRSIPAVRWPRLVRAAERRGYPGVTEAELAAMAVRERRKKAKAGESYSQKMIRSRPVHDSRHRGAKVASATNP